MKLATNKEVHGKPFWVQYQDYDHVNGRGGVQIVGSKVYRDFYYDTQENQREIWPTIPVSWTGTATILREWGYELERHGSETHGHFHGCYIVKKKNPSVKLFTAPLLVVGTLTRAQNEAVGLGNNLIIGEKHILDMEDKYTGSVIDSSEIDEVRGKITEATDEWTRRKKMSFSLEFFKSSSDGVTAIMDLGGDETFEFNDLSEDFLVLACFKIANTQNSRQRKTDTYRYILLNKNAGEGNKINISIPAEYQGKVIGKGGDNIKALSAKLGKQIYVLKS